MKPTPRIVRTQSPPKMRGDRGYLRCREHLRIDFAHRCAYCLIHEQEAAGPEGFEVDHFKPRSKGGSINAYTNLYWCCAGCNMFKGDFWPTAELRRNGCRFIDPCTETDYGVHFYENEDCVLVALTPTGSYHIDKLRLNRPDRCARRRRRKELEAKINAVAERFQSIGALEGLSETQRQMLETFKQCVDQLRRELDVAIPFFPLLTKTHGVERRPARTTARQVRHVGVE
jgi:hypothetical protein